MAIICLLGICFQGVEKGVLWAAACLPSYCWRRTAPYWLVSSLPCSEAFYLLFTVYLKNARVFHLLLTIAHSEAWVSPSASALHTCLGWFEILSVPWYPAITHLHAISFPSSRSFPSTKATLISGWMWAPLPALRFWEPSLQQENVDEAEP